MKIGKYISREGAFHDLHFKNNSVHLWRFAFNL